MTVREDWLAGNICPCCGMRDIPRHPIAEGVYICDTCADEQKPCPTVYDPIIREAFLEGIVSGATDEEIYKHYQSLLAKRN